MLLDTRQARVIEIEVTQEDIDKAYALKEGFLSQRCALAVALSRQMGGTWSVNHDHATNVGPDGVLRWHDHDGRRLVCAFDAGYPETGRVRLTR